MLSEGLETLRIVGESAVAEVLEWGPLLDVLEVAMVDFSAGNVAQPVRQIVPVPGHDAIMAAMPAIGAEAMAVKIVTLYHDNAAIGLPSHQGVIMVLDKNNGSPLALLDGRLITEMRTAAGSAAAARKLAVADPEVVTILGNGVQARAHAEALAVVRDWTELRLWARNPERGQELAEEIGAIWFDDAEAAVREADIVACTTAAKEPIVHGSWLKPGAFVTAVGWNTPDGRELDTAVMANTVIVESVDAAQDQAGNIRGSGCEIFAEIGEIYSGIKTVPVGATIIFDSVGIAIMDAVAAQLTYDLWRAGT
jgi:ornithine cyclodeaminase/alanine dehydrogenase-like protein (mu-crystallin family)